MYAMRTPVPGTEAPLPGSEATLVGLAALAVVIIPVSVPAAIALLAVVTRHAHDGLEEVIVYGMTWLLLLSGVRVAVAHGADAKDAKNLSKTTHIPRQIWALLWLAGTLLAVAAGGKWLVLRS